MTEGEKAIVKIIAQEVVKEASEEFGEVVDDKIRLHYSETRKAEEELIDKKVDDKIAVHAGGCFVASTFKITKTKIAVASALFVFISGGSAELVKKVFEFISSLM